MRTDISARLSGVGTITFVASLASLVACQPLNDETTAKLHADIATLNTRLGELDALSARVGALEASQDVQQNTIRRLLSQARRDAIQYVAAEFNPAADEGFQRVDTSLGTTLVVLDDVQPFADGSRIELHIGNMTNGNLAKVTLKVMWNSKEPVEPPETATADERAAYDEAFVKWLEGERSKDVELTQSLSRGAWTVVTTNVPGVPPDELGYVRIALDAGQVSLTNPR